MLRWVDNLYATLALSEAQNPIPNLIERTHLQVALNDIPSSV